MTSLDRLLLAATLGLACLGCDDGATSDAMADAMPDAMLDAMPDAMTDAMPDAVDAAPDAMRDAMSDAMRDAMSDAMPESDAGEDMALDMAPAEACLRPPLIEASAARILHVAPDGDDDGGDGSRDRPYGTLAHAVGLATPGTEVRLLPGRYPGGTFLEGVRGAEDAPIIIGGDPAAERPVIDATGRNEGLHLIRPRWLILRHIEVRGASDNGINVDDGGDYADPEAARFVVFDGLVIEDIGPAGNRDCLKLSGLDDFEVRGSAFARCGDGGSAVDMVGCHDGFIRGNHFEALGSSGVQAKGGTARVRIEGNRFVGAGARPVNMGGSTGFEFFRPPLDAAAPNAEARHIEVVSNLVTGSQTAAAFVGCVECVFAHNTVIDPGNWLLRILQETTTRDGFTFEPVRDGLVTGNLFVYGAAVRTAVNVGPDTDAASFRFVNDLFFDRDAAGGVIPNLPAGPTDPVAGDPLLDDAYHPQPGSPAIGGGLTRPGLLGADLDGRCYADPPTIGAFERPERAPGG